MIVERWKRFLSRQIEHNVFPVGKSDGLSLGGLFLPIEGTFGRLDDEATLPMFGKRG